MRDGRVQTPPPNTYSQWLVVAPVGPAVDSATPLSTCPPRLALRQSLPVKLEAEVEAVDDEGFVLAAVEHADVRQRVIDAATGAASASRY
jgi:hypothetical protein